jgi:hypothetical protein
MTILTTIAVTASIVVIAFGIATLFAERGYRFDLRKRRRKVIVVGGRRSNDDVIAG